MMKNKNWKPVIPVSVSFTENNVTKTGVCDLKICRYNPIVNKWTIIVEIANLENDLFESIVEYPTK